MGVAAQRKSQMVSKIERVLSGENVWPPPVWMMRQAGRYLPEYRELRTKHTLLEMFMNPNLATEVTLQPLRRYPLDAGIIFADILTPLISCGISLDFKEGEGPVIDNPLRSMEDLNRFLIPPAEEGSHFTMEAIRKVVAELQGSDCPLLGFSGAPFTLASYLITGRGGQNVDKVRSLLFTEHEFWHSLQLKLVDLVSEYLIAQVKAGVVAVQLFDSWVGGLSPSHYQRFVFPYLKEIILRYKEAVDAPLIYYFAGNPGLLPVVCQLPFDGLSVDWRCELAEVRKALSANHKDSCAIQGNLDPALLLGDRSFCLSETATLLNEARNQMPYIFNLGHGILQWSNPTLVGDVISLVKAG